MSGETRRKVVSITSAKGYDAAQGDHRREQGESAEVVPADFRRETLVQLVSGSSISFAYVPSEDPDALDLIITIPGWVFELVSSVGLKKEVDPPRGAMG